MIFYDMREVEDELLDKGEEIPTLQEWIGEKEYIQRELKKGRLWFGPEKKNPYYLISTYQFAAMDLHLKDTIIPNDMERFYVDYGREPGDEIKVVRSPEPRYTPGTKKYEDERTTFNDISIERILYSSGKEKGVRQSTYQGYNVPEVFQWNNYDQIPPQPDYRRTLYWNPHVQLDASGKAQLTFHNSSTGEKLQIVVEGLTRDGKPIVGRITNSQK